VRWQKRSGGCSFIESRRALGQMGADGSSKGPAGVGSRGPAASSRRRCGATPPPRGPAGIGSRGPAASPRRRWGAAAQRRWGAAPPPRGPVEARSRVPTGGAGHPRRGIHHQWSFRRHQSEAPVARNLFGPVLAVDLATGTVVCKGWWLVLPNPRWPCLFFMDRREGVREERSEPVRTLAVAWWVISMVTQ
jgi:hypothetical protein